MRTGTFSILILILLAGLNASAMKIDEHDYADEITVKDQKLKLNCVALRKVKKFGMNWSVHTGALYTKDRVTDGQALIDSTDLRVLKYTYLRKITKEQVNEALDEMFAETCKAVLEPSKCPAVKAELAKLNEIRPNMKDGSTTDYYYYADHADYELKGDKEVKGTIAGADAVKVMLAMTFGPKPGSEDLKVALLGGCRK